MATLRRDRRNAKPKPAKPTSIIAQVDGSGTAGVTEEAEKVRVPLSAKLMNVRGSIPTIPDSNALSPVVTSVIERVQSAS